jgi:serine/threonine protein kinase
MGVVWAAEDIATHKHIALKFMKDVAGDPDARRRFLREGRAASAVRHPNVVSILDVLEPESEPPAIVMELLEGETLRDLLERERRIALTALVNILVPVISAVGTAHALGVVHRDLKPENIFLARGPTGERVVKVLDFGIAKLTALDGEAARSSGITTTAVLGTPAYMAPEQVFGEKDVDHLADIWALGILLYQCLSGVLPTQGENVGQVLKHVLAKPFEPLEQLVPDLPPDISRLVARMLARERAERPADLREVLEILQKLAPGEWQGFGPPAQRLTAYEMPVTATAPTPEPAVEPVSRERVRDRGRRWIVIGAAGAALSIALIRYGIFGDEPSPVDASCPDGMVPVPAGTFWMGSPDESATATSTRSTRSRYRRTAWTKRR